MTRELNGPCLSAVFVDYDNIYLSLKRKSEDAAKRFAKDAPTWIRAIENGQLITATNGVLGTTKRRIVMNRCYGNPVPRRNSHDNSTDMNSFPFVRHHFLRAGFEVVDCPPLTAQLKNSADIRMVMDMRDYLLHDTYFDEFVILSGDADFTPVLHRLRQHARRTVIFANDYTAAPYTAICDGEVRESDLIAMLLEGRPASIAESADAQIASPHPAPLQAVTTPPAAPPAPRLDEIRAGIIAEVVAGVRAAAAPVPLEALADRALRAVGHERTIGTAWAGAGSFRELLRQNLPSEIRLSEQPPYFAYDPKRHGGEPAAADDLHRAERPRHQPAIEQAQAPDAFEIRPGQLVAAQSTPAHQGLMPAPTPTRAPAADATAARLDTRFEGPSPRAALAARPAQAAAQSKPAASVPVRAEAAATGDPSAAMQQSIARIHEACQAPSLSPPEYRILFEAMAQEINDNGLTGAQTLSGIIKRAAERGLDVRREEVRFALEVVSETDPWFEQGASANLFAGRFRNFVVARCRAQGLNLSAGELDLVDAWFAGAPMPQSGARPAVSGASRPQAQLAAEPQQTAAAASATEPRATGNRWWSLDEGRAPTAESRPAPAPAKAPVEDEADDFPRIVRTRVRG